MDKIIIQGLQVNSLIGVYEWERKAKQPLLVDVELSLDLSTAAASDNIQHTLNYAAIANDLNIIAEKSQFELLEALAGSFINNLLAYKGVTRVMVTITKPKILDNAQAVSVQLCRDKI